MRRSGVERQEVLAKLRAIRKNVVEHVATQARHFDPLYVLDLFERYATVRDALKAVLPSLFEDLPVREDPTSRTAASITFWRFARSPRASRRRAALTKGNCGRSPAIPGHSC